MSTMESLALARDVAELAQRAGADDARVKLSRAREVRLEWRDGRLEAIRESHAQRLNLSLFVAGRFTSCGTSDLRPPALAGYVDSWVAAARLLAVDEHRRLPPPSRYRGRVEEPQLELRDPTAAERTPAERRTIARELEDAARSGEGSEQIIAVSSWVADTTYESVCLNTNGLEATEVGTHGGYGLMVSVRDGNGRRPQGMAHGVARHRQDLPSVAALGGEARERALAQIGARQIDTGRYPIVIDNRAVPRLAGQLLAPLSGDALHQRASFLHDRLGATIGSPLLTLRDEPHQPRGLGSTAWDGEGMATRPRPIFEAGTLRTFFLDTYYAAKLGREATTGGPSNLRWQPGARGGRAMLADLDRGLFITDFLGGNANRTSGDFSAGIEGFYVEAGEIQHPVAEMNLAGNHGDFWLRLVEVGDDPWRSSAHQAPSLRFAKVSCSGA